MFTPLKAISKDNAVNDVVKLNLIFMLELLPPWHILTYIDICLKCELRACHWSKLAPIECIHFLNQVFYVRKCYSTFVLYTIKYVVYVHLIDDCFVVNY